MTDIKAQDMTKKATREECYQLAEERGYCPFAALRGGMLILRINVIPAARHEIEVDYVEEVLAPRGLVPYDYLVKDWTDAKRLLGMLPPARG